MEDNNIMTTDVEVMDNDLAAYETTDLVPVEAADNSEGGIDAGSVALGALAIVGAGFLLKKAVDGGKWVVGKVSDWNEARKEKKAAKAKGKDEDEEAADQESEAEAPEETEEKTSKPDKKAKK